MDHDSVNHPRHYTRGAIEVADFIDDQDLGWKEANIVKYVCRWKYKNGVEDLRKARWYLDRLIAQNESGETICKASAEHPKNS